MATAAILSALMNLQEKIRKLELERGRTELSLHSLERETSHTALRSDTHKLRDTHKPTDTHNERETSHTALRSDTHTLRDTHKPTDTHERETSHTALRSDTHTLRDTHKPTDTHERETSHTALRSDTHTLRDTHKPTDTHERETSHTALRSDTHTLRDTHKPTDTHERETSNQSEHSQVLVTQLAAAEARCKLLDRQLEYMRKMVRNAEADRTTLLKRQVSLEMTRSAAPAPAPDSAHLAQLEKLELLEQEYQRLTRTQNHAERKIRELELKLLQEEHQRKLVQHQTNQLQTGLEANRILIQSVSPSPRLPKDRSTIREKKRLSKKPVLQQTSYTQPHYRLSLGDVPFVAGKSVGCSHSVRANVQSVLSLLKQHQPQLCNARVLSHTPLAQPANGSGSSSSCGEELSDLLLALQDELGHMSLEQQELVRQAETCVCERERRGVEREQETLLRRMERKAEQISKLRRHQAQVKRFRRDARQKQSGEVKVTTRGRSAGAVKVRPGDRSRKSLTLLRDMKSLQTSLHPNQPQWSY
ncbi:centrosomal protein of 57 kDa isoform X2 [Oncorhynchus kisutch]|uniref:centrosomal protein of 57 kDa isoform X2 n=1 Tax=Oncorhynchus kisutch TaxID=8019 RepID=UPI0012DE5F64|nr:centrosomal protein of 57 kDa isoform X2 [Oncorhynchus kisutch]